MRRRLRTIAGWPARRVLDRRVQWILAALEERIGPSPPRPSLHHRLDLLERDLAQANAALGEALLERRLAATPGRDARALAADTAHFLNWAEGPEGPAAQSGLWFNPPVPVRYSQGGVEVLLVNERIVEQPYVFGALSFLAPGARVLDVGGGESTVALSLACLGHEVQVVDPRGYRLAHPNLHVHRLRLDELPRGEPFDAVVALSAIEHFGLGAYGGGLHAERADVDALADIRGRLAPGGLLVLTVPMGQQDAIDDFQRRYSAESLRDLLAGWAVHDSTLVWRQDHHTWVRGGPPQAEGVALVTATPRRT